MTVPVPLGQYVDADSPVHRLDARAKLLVIVALTAALFIVDTWAGLFVVAFVAVATIVLARVPVRVAARGLLPVLWILGFTLVVNSLWPVMRSHTVAQLGPLAVDAVGLRTGAFFALRIVTLMLGASLLTLTTSPVALTDALASLIRPLGRLRFPVDDMAMMLSIALRFLPVTAEEIERTVVAQTARGARFDEGGLIARARAWMPVLVPLFVRLFRRADDLALAMESRCYRGVGRTRLHEPHMRGADWMVLFTGVTVALALGILA